MFQKIFSLKERKTDVKTEILAGLTVFVMTCYIFALNPAVLSQAGIPATAVFTATGVASVLSMLLMGFCANLPLVMSGGMGLNAFLVYSVCLGMGYSYETGLTALLFSGLTFLVLALFNLHHAVVDSMPLSLKHAVSAGIGLFIAFVGAKGCGFIVADKATFVALGKFNSPESMTALIGFFVTLALYMRHIRGGFLIGILTATLAGIPLGATQLPENFSVFALPEKPLFADFSFDGILTIDFFLICFTFLFLNVFDTLGTLLAVCSQAKLLKNDGSVLKIREAFFCAGFATVIGSVFATTVTGFIESVTAVAEGGRTGLSTVIVAGLFALALFFSPIFLLVPFSAVAPVLIIIGFLMASSLNKIDFSSVCDGLPAFVCVTGMVLTFSIVNGIVFGLLCYVFCAVFCGKIHEIKPWTWGLAGLCLLKTIL